MKTIQELEAQLAELKSDFIRLQGDVEKIESIGGNVAQSVKQLINLEDEIAQVRKELNNALQEGQEK
ncbi:ribosomal protein L29 [Alkalihalobacillus xiaoxiensis]|uniref:Ribosomal protein L29 n=1 Tax=Shouchella xiaoxiensis TaxID=766895 RepID=A0ABS2T058_9BACI|nr:SE1832 family protein [Shouchella xiaoxiensis]MBM7841163.1 ribosomal protein L29 [Shouchella xiaoxiensis]